MDVRITPSLMLFPIRSGSGARAGQCTSWGGGRCSCSSLYASRASSSPRSYRRPGQTQGDLVICRCHARKFERGSREEIYDASLQLCAVSKLRTFLRRGWCTCNDRICSRRKWPSRVPFDPVRGVMLAFSSDRTMVLAWK